MSRYSWKTYQGNGRYRVTAGAIPLKYSPAGPDAKATTLVDFAPQRITTAVLDGWRTVQGDFHYALGQPGTAAPGSGVFEGADGTFGFGARQGQNWLLWRWAQVAHIHWPTRTILDIDSTPNYDRANLVTEPIVSTVQGQAVNVGLRVTWSDIFTTPGGGSAGIEYACFGDRVKETITLDQVGREWVEANRGLTWARTELNAITGNPDHLTAPADEFYFGFVFGVDWGDIPTRVRDGVVLGVDDDFDNDLPVSARDNAERVLWSLPIGAAKMGGPGSTPPRVTNRDQYVQPLRTRFWRQGGLDFIGIGLRFDRMATLVPGPLEFDPQVSDAFTQHGEQENTSWLESGFSGTCYQTESGSESNAVRADVSGESIPNGSTVSAAQWQHTADTETSGATDVNIRVSDSASSTALSGSRLPESETQVGSDETWQIGDGGGTHTSPDSGNMAAALQSLFQSGAWPGNENIVVWLEGAGGSNYVSTQDNTANIDFFYDAPAGGLGDLVDGGLVGDGIIDGGLIQ